MKYKLGIIGYGGMAAWHHSNSSRIENLEVTAAYDIDPERLKLAEEKGLVVCSTVDELLAMDVDIILIACPNNFHKEYAIYAMSKGKHVVCEKPVALNVAELDEMIDASKKYGVLFTVHQNRRWDRDFNIVKKAIADHMLGKPYSIESRVHGQNGGFLGWREFKVAGGGMLYDWGVHLIDQILYLVDEKVTEVYAQLFSIKEIEVDDYFKLLLRFESGLSAQLEVGTYCLQPLPRWYVNGDLGSLVIKNWDCEGSVITANQYAMDWEPIIVQTSAGPTRTMAPRPKETLTETKLPEVDVDWACFYQNVLATLDGKEELIVKLPEVRRVMQVIDAAFASNEQGISIKTNI